MGQPRHQLRNVQRKNPSLSAGRLLKFFSWTWAVTGILLGIGEFSPAPWLSALIIVLGIFLIPPIRKRIGSTIGIRLAQPVALALAVGIFCSMYAIGADIRRRTEAETAKQAAIAKEERYRDSVFTVQYPFVNTDSLHVWRKVAGDSMTNPNHTLTLFLKEQKDIYQHHLADSIAQARQWRQDSLVAAKQKRQDSLKAVQESRRAVAESRRLTQQNEETYNGHTIYTGPRGGRYYINSHGNKTYVH